MSATELLIPPDVNNAEKGSITSDFAYNNNVASSHIYIRMGFLRKVYGLLSAQLILTTIVSAICAYVEPIRVGLQANTWVLFPLIPLSFGILIALAVKRHQVPANFFLLAGFTIIQSIDVGIIISLYEVESVIKALVLTLVITISLTLYTLQSKRDFSPMGSSLMVALISLIGFGFMNIFVQSQGLELVLGSFGALVFSLFIVYDTHMLMKRLSPEEYILATINLYLDILNLFLELLRIFGERRH